MFLAKVEGSVVATKKDPAMSGRKMLLLRPQLVDEKDPTKFRPGANTIVAVDTVGGSGEERPVVGTPCCTDGACSGGGGQHGGDAGQHGDGEGEVLRVGLERLEHRAGHGEDAGIARRDDDDAPPPPLPGLGAAAADGGGVRHAPVGLRHAHERVGRAAAARHRAVVVVLWSNWFFQLPA